MSFLKLPPVANDYRPANELDFHLPLATDLSLDVLHSRESSEVRWRHRESSQSLSLYFYQGENNTLDLELFRGTETIETLENSAISHYSVSGAYHPTTRLAFGSEVGLTSSLDRWSGAKSRTPWVSFSVSYIAIEDILEFTSFASYGTTRGADSNHRAIDAGAGFIWTPVDSPLEGTTFFLDLMYGHYRDDVSTESSYDDLSLQIWWELFSF